MYGQVKKWPDEIRLKDGTLIIGEIVEHKPDKGYWILLPTGETKFYKNEDIESVRDKEDNTKEKIKHYLLFCITTITLLRLYLLCSK